MTRPRVRCGENGEILIFAQRSEGAKAAAADAD